MIAYIVIIPKCMGSSCSLLGYLSNAFKGLTVQKCPLTDKMCACDKMCEKAYCTQVDRQILAQIKSTVSVHDLKVDRDSSCTSSSIIYSTFKISSGLQRDTVATLSAYTDLAGGKKLWATIQHWCLHCLAVRSAFCPVRMCLLAFPQQQRWQSSVSLIQSATVKL